MIQLLLLRFQKGDADGTPWWPGPPITLNEFVAFVERLGLAVAEVDTFSPFDHEVVRVDSENSQRSVCVVDHYWPRVTLGSMIIARGGVHVRASTDKMNKRVAENSLMFWAYRRKNRPYEDLSHGWGSNSQWRTTFRRDYRLDGVAYYNVDGEYDVRDSSDDDEWRQKRLAKEGLTREERIALVTNRCFITIAPPDQRNIWPYDDRFSAEATN